jgi:hypothetical protein
MGKACADHEVHFTVSRWIATMLSNRMVRAEIRGVISTMMVRREVFSHSLLGRLSLWAQGCVDEIAIVINGKFLSTGCELIQ